MTGFVVQGHIYALKYNQTVYTFSIFKILKILSRLDV